MSAPTKVILNSVVLINNSVGFPYDGWQSFRHVGAIKSRIYCSLKTGPSSLVIKRGVRTGQKDFCRESIEDLEVTDSCWDADNLWEQTVPLKLHDGLWPSMSGGWQGRSNYFPCLLWPCSSSDVTHRIVSWKKKKTKQKQNKTKIFHPYLNITIPPHSNHKRH